MSSFADPIKTSLKENVQWKILRSLLATALAMLRIQGREVYSIDWIRDKVLDLNPEHSLARERAAREGSPPGTQPLLDFYNSYTHLIARCCKRRSSIR